jgi:hypothetical protein
MHRWTPCGNGRHGLRIQACPLVIMIKMGLAGKPAGPLANSRRPVRRLPIC